MPYKDPEVKKQKHKEYSRKHYLKNREKTIKRTQQWKENNREQSRKHSKEVRRRKDPTIRIGDAIGDFIRGNIGHDEYVRRVQSVIDETDEYGS